MWACSLRRAISFLTSSNAASAVEQVLPLVQTAAALHDPMPLPAAVRSLFSFLLQTTGAASGVLVVHSYDPGREPVEILHAGSWIVAAGAVAAPPPSDEKHWRAHDRVVRSLADAANALLPFRFGSTVADIAAELAMTPERVSDEKYKAIQKLRAHFESVAQPVD